MSNELFVLQYDTNGKPWVSGRDLHQMLGVKTQYNHWITRMIDYGFVEGVDFWNKKLKSTGGRPSYDCLMTTAMAKNIACIHRRGNGSEFRKVYIALEELECNEVII